MNSRGGTAVLVAAEDLWAGQEQLVLLDVRWSLADPRGRELYRSGHLPGAVFVDLDGELSEPPSAAEGRHPLPSLQRLQSAARRWGIHEGDRVAVYDDAGGLAAARAWWLLRWGGLPDVRLLDGGLAAWSRAGGPLETGDVVPEPGDVTLRGGGMPVLTIDDAAGLPGAGGVLLDARAAERYRGDVEPIDPRAGHVPGAVSAPTTENLGGDGRFLPAAVLTARFAELGIGPGRPVAAYCGSGVAAAHEVAALAVAGIEAALWPGSWSQWSNDPDRPVATGPRP
ncbi:sulfurtransferase [Geodermatophilus sabuli]|uniref:Thiosulfate/3-mercaptopyruvate sulfurtransferase n=1 Tax=Geodermatophilus sabuli TaxID=1564158 RepID=A0A285EAN4_9ACTN|nr:sulfurtransferase [Geodermatophilus sabuli]MBB3085647.1 thiosulfate/3-mercaptopyruvate sulfurtransferase [Geodermatophilus sabuli]SNX95933.1 thiosulfate/3-mercaptopyruvate sulfurtransferase [Geodermatophilus sabuli]